MFVPRLDENNSLQKDCPTANRRSCESAFSLFILFLSMLSSSLVAQSNPAQNPCHSDHRNRKRHAFNGNSGFTLNELYRNFRTGNVLTLADPALIPEGLIG